MSKTFLFPFLGSISAALSSPIYHRVVLLLVIKPITFSVEVVSFWSQIRLEPRSEWSFTGLIQIFGRASPTFPYGSPQQAVVPDSSVLRGDSTWNMPLHSCLHNPDFIKTPADPNKLYITEKLLACKLQKCVNAMLLSVTSDSQSITCCVCPLCSRETIFTTGIKNVFLLEF